MSTIVYTSIVTFRDKWSGPGAEGMGTGENMDIIGTWRVVRIGAFGREVATLFTGTYAEACAFADSQPSGPRIAVRLNLPSGAVASFDR
jgi:hypothetical protein